MFARFPVIVSAFALGLLLPPCLATAWQPGTYPPPQQRMHSRGFEVDNHDRNDVVSFWHAVYRASEGYGQRIQWNGNYTGRAGSVSRAFSNDVERRLNYFRAMCGVPANARVNTSATVVIQPADRHRPAASTRKAAAAQESALMIIRNYNPSTGTAPGMDHDPLSSLAGWSPATWNANANGNLAFGVYGPGAITEYMIEELTTGSATSAWNALVGHRRWCLVPEATNFATGDQPGESATRPPTNVLYVTQTEEELRAGLSQDFVAYPAAGFFPAPINSRFWSLSREGADFSGARVSMTDAAGKPVPVHSVRRNASYGKPAIIWEVGGAAAARSITTDRTFQVSVTGIGHDGATVRHDYGVTLINPNRLTFNRALQGPARLAANGSAGFRFARPSGVEAVRVETFRRRAVKWKEGAEGNLKRKVADRTSPSYPLRVDAAQLAGYGVIAGKRSFRLTFPTAYDLKARGVPDQIFEIERSVLPKNRATMRYQFRRGFMTRGSILVTEISSDGGANWKRVGSPIRGVSDTNLNAAVSDVTVKLPKSNSPLRVRFRYFAERGKPIYTHQAAPKAPTGIFIDEIQFRKCDWIEPRRTTPGGAANSFTFNSTSAGMKIKPGDRWLLGTSHRLGGVWFPTGPLKAVRVTK